MVDIVKFRLRTGETICADFQHSMPGVKVIYGLVGAAPKAVGAGSLPFISRFTAQQRFWWRSATQIPLKGGYGFFIYRKFGCAL
jgi:hypothetical protein